MDNRLFSPSPPSSSLSQLAEPPSLDSTWISEANGSILDCDHSLNVSIACTIPTIIGNRSHKRKHHVRSRCVNTIPTVPDFVPNVMVSNIRGGLCSKLDEIATVLEHNAISVACLPESWLKPPIANELIQICLLPRRSIRWPPRGRSRSVG